MNTIAKHLYSGAVILKRFWQEEDAPTAVEYAIIVSIGAVIIAAAATALFTAVNRGFESAAGAIK
jgi:pilus assembly protein Flp/PilA